MNIKPSDIKLPSGYRRVSLIDVQLKLNAWVTIAKFSSSTSGQFHAYAKRVHGDNETKEISSEEYVSLVKKHIGED